MIRATAIIGGNYGDEGKGLATDFFASQNSNSVVVRFNGGAQAGHTVVTPEGQRHVFHHFGAGSFCGIPTYLTKYFIVNPLLWKQEFEELKAIGVNPTMFLDYHSPVSTPYDMLLNQAIERSRGDKAHGSVGVGIHETMYRTINGFCLCVEDLFDPSYVAIALDEILHRYVPERLKTYQINPEIVKTWNINKINQDFVEMSYEMLKTHDVSLDIMEFQKQHLIFEGAQGLGLDAQFGVFPHVTPSKCGVYNIIEMFEDLESDTSINLKLDVYYISRTYITRHGNGPLPHENPDLKNKLTDTTNLPNLWQGSLRYAPLNNDNLNSFTKRIRLDSESVLQTILNSKNHYDLHTKAFFTHHDQIKLDPGFACDNVPYVSNGPTRNDVHSSSLILV